MVQDTFPRFPPPRDLLPQLSGIDRGWCFQSAIENNKVNTRTFLPAHSPLVEIFQDMHRLNATIKASREPKPLWQEAMFQGLHIMPLIYRLLILPRIYPSHD